MGCNAGEHVDGDPRVLAGAQLAVARHLVLTCLLEPAGDALGGDDDRSSDAATAYRSAADLLGRIGWPDDPRRGIAIGAADAEMVRLAALAGLGAVGEAIDEAARAAANGPAQWDADGAITEFEDIVRLLDVIGWPDGSGRRQVSGTAPGPSDDTELIAFGARLPTPMYLWREGRIQHRNPAALALLREMGLDPADAPVTAIIHPDDLREFGGRLAAAEAEQRPFRGEVRLAGGGRRRLILSGAPRFGPDGAFLGFVVLAVDGPDDGMGLLHWATDREGRLTGATAGVLRHLGMDLPAALGQGWLGGVHEEDRERLRAALATAHRDAAALRLEVRTRDGDGGWHPVRLLAEPRLEAHGFGGLSGVLVPGGPPPPDLR